MWDCLLDGISIAGKVASFDIPKGGGAFCKELTLGLQDYTLADGFDFDQVPEAPRIEIRTEVDGIWATEGIFFIEKPTEVQTKDSITIPALWGRDISARLTQPFAARVSKEWPDDTTLFAVIQELLGGCGLEYDAARILINDYKIYAGSYPVSSRYPLEILAELVGKTDGYLYTDCNNKLWVLRDLYHWAEPTQVIHGGQIQQVTTSREYPDFSNRIKVGSYSRTDEANIAISLELDDSSIAINTTTPARAVVTHLDGTPVADGYAVDWLTDNAAYAHWLNAQTHVYTHRFKDAECETQYASSRYLISTTYPIRQIHSVTEVQTGLPKTVKEFKGRSITLSEPLDFIDSAVLIDYETAWGENILVAGAVGEVEVDVHALVETYIRDTVVIRIDTVSGSASADKDMLVTVIIKDFVTEAVIPGAVPAVDGAVKAPVDENGELDLGLMAGGIHTISVVKDGYKATEDDGLDNDSFYCGT
jgi:hypothetical protein